MNLQKSTIYTIQAVTLLSLVAATAIATDRILNFLVLAGFGDRIIHATLWIVLLSFFATWFYKNVIRK